ncbi:Interferon-induced protein 44 [Pelomyxa schiedti]|nr:Interferon-induced protein 44 [Pelomyxa schiedti]
MSSGASQRQRLIDYVPGRSASYPNVSKVFDGVTAERRRIRIAVVGQAGTGKTSLINTIYRVLDETGLTGTFRCPVQNSGCEGTVQVEDVVVSKGISLVDTRGFFTSNGAEGMAFVRIIEGIYQHGHIMEWIPEDEVVTDFAKAKKMIEDQDELSPSYVDRVHGVIWVMKANDPRLTSNQYLAALSIPRQWCRMCGIAPIVVITHNDTITSAQQRDTVAKCASAACSCPPSSIFFISNYTNPLQVVNNETDQTVMNILDTAIQYAERFINFHPPPPPPTLVSVRTLENNQVKFKIPATLTFKELRTLVSRRARMDPSLFFIAELEVDDELLDSDKVLKFGTEFRMIKGYTAEISQRVPPYWGTDPWGPTGHKELDVPPDSEEFKFITYTVQTSYDCHSLSKLGCVGGKWPGGLKVKKITRIQDRLQWEAYTNFKSILKERLGKSADSLESSLYLKNKPMNTPLLDPSSNEYLLFHGCASEALPPLTQNGANTHMFGMFGEGFYLAENSSKANWYIPCPQCHLPCRREEASTRGNATANCTSPTATGPGSTPGPGSSPGPGSTPGPGMTPGPGSTSGLCSQPGPGSTSGPGATSSSPGSTQSSASASSAGTSAASTPQWYSQIEDSDMYFPELSTNQPPGGRCQCPAPENIECKMLLFRAALGDVHICDGYNAGIYRGPPEAPVRKPPMNAATGISFDSVVAEKYELCPQAKQFQNFPERNPKAREVVIYSQNQAYAEYVVVFTRSIEDLPMPPPAPCFEAKMSVLY